MNQIYQFKHFNNKEVANYFLKEASKACQANSKLTWIGQYIQKGGTIPAKDEFKKPFNVSAIARENRTEKMEKYSLKPSIIDEFSQKALTWIEARKTSPGVAIDLGGGNSTLALTLLQKKWKVIVVDPSEKGLYLLRMRAQFQGLESIAKTNLSLIPQKMEEFTFPNNVDFISAQDSLPYCDAAKVVSLWEKIHSSLTNDGYFAANFFNSCSYKDSSSDLEYAQILDDDTPASGKEIVYRVQLGAWMSSPSIAYSLLKNNSYNIDYFSLSRTSIEFIGRK